MKKKNRYMFLQDLSPSCPKFVATQSPLPVTLVDFWCMVYEQGVEVLVTLSSEIEVGKVCVTLTIDYPLNTNVMKLALDNRVWDLEFCECHIICIEKFVMKVRKCLTLCIENDKGSPLKF